MQQGVQSLSEREKETLRLLLGGHDAKSIARSLGLSVHTVNERLREARRKLEVSSSREAARLLSEAEAPKSVGDKQLGLAPGALSMERDRATSRRNEMGRPLVWLGGGMLIMSLIVATLAAALFVGNASQASHAQAAAQAPAIAETAQTRAAREWLALLDTHRYGESWDLTAPAFRAGMPRDRWATAAGPVREAFGPVSSRLLLGEIRTSALPDAPPGDYDVIQFKSSFARRPDAVETVTFVHDGAGWMVTGYFIR